MSNPTIHIHLPLRRMLKEQDAAEYCGLDLKRFKSACHISPLEIAPGKHRYDKDDLDQWIDGMKIGTHSTADEYIGLLN